MGWDEHLQGASKDSYDKVVSEISNVQTVSIPRCLFAANKEVRPVQLHAFSDASEKAFATSVYLGVEYKADKVDARLLLPRQKYGRPLLDQNITVLTQNVQNHVDHSLKLSSKEEWHFCSGHLNPADFPSRGRVGPRLLENRTWWERSYVSKASYSRMA